VLLEYRRRHVTELAVDVSGNQVLLTDFLLDRVH
jgi:hypothetical protein